MVLYLPIAFGLISDRGRISRNIGDVKPASERRREQGKNI